MSQFATIDEIISKFHDGMTIMVGGFLSNGSANTILKALAQSDIKDLTIIANDTAFADRGNGVLLNKKQVRKLITSYIGGTPAALEQMNSGETEVEFCPQGSLIERIRCGGYGLGGVLTPTGLGTIIAEGKQVVNVDGKDFLLEKPLRADIALIGASKADEAGNLWFRGTSSNFNPMMATAADLVIVEPEEVVPVGAIEPENVHTPGMLVDLILKK